MLCERAALMDQITARLTKSTSKGATVETDYFCFGTFTPLTDLLRKRRRFDVFILWLGLLILGGGNDLEIGFNDGVDRKFQHFFNWKEGSAGSTLVKQFFWGYPI